MNITWVTSLPTGQETGTYLALDLGGTNLRVCRITLKSGDAEVEQEKYLLPSSTKTGTSNDLWDFIADSLEKYVADHPSGSAKDGELLPLGFTFSYPATQDRIDHGLLQTWTKGWDVNDVEGKDVAALLRSAIEKRKIPVKLVALINDTTGALIASRYKDPETIIGAIFGTGCNAAYIEKCNNIPKLKAYDQNISQVGTGHEDDMMAINCEYGAFDNSHKVLPRTPYDEAIDKESPRPGEQSFEKMSAGLYLGEIFRQAVVDMWRRGVLFQSDQGRADQNGNERKSLDEPYSMDTGFLSQIENDESKELADSRRLFESTVYLPTGENKSKRLSPSSEELLFLRHLAQLIAVRGARLCACGVSALCKRQGSTTGHVAADGSVAIKHPHFRRRWEAAVAEILDLEVGKIQLTAAEDGSGIGAAVIVALTMAK
ncbi:hexokinase [Exophiala viscosa]|uniref:hexokinase n=1 Tax=Exophiala viscosa TaxID=2486360 RepID=UPI00219DEC45|nr:hexokinase [Exophiala viscosa]